MVEREKPEAGDAKFRKAAYLVRIAVHKGPRIPFVNHGIFIPNISQRHRRTGNSHLGQQLRVSEGRPEPDVNQQDWPASDPRETGTTAGFRCQYAQRSARRA